MTWPIPTSGEAMVSLKGRVGSTRYRRGSKRKRAFKKYSGHTWWAVYNDDTVLTVPPVLGSGLDAVRWVDIGPNTGLAAMDVGGSYVPSLVQNIHLLRFDGAIHVGMQMQDDRDVDSNGCHPNETWVWWYWRKEVGRMGGSTYPSEDAQGGTQAYDLQDVAAEANISYAQYFNTLMQRRDIIRWGICKVIGPQLRGMDTITPAPLADGHQGYREGTVIPFPKIPAGGFKLTGEDRLSLWVSASPPFARPVVGTAYGYSNTTSPRVVFGMPAFRMLLAR